MSFEHMLSWSSDSILFLPIDVYIFCCSLGCCSHLGLYLFTDICPVNKESTEHSSLQAIAIVFYSQPVDRFIAGEKIQGKQNEVTKRGEKLSKALSLLVNEEKEISENSYRWNKLIGQCKELTLPWPVWNQPISSQIISNNLTKVIPHPSAFLYQPSLHIFLILFFYCIQALSINCLVFLGLFFSKVFPVT